MLKEKQKKLSQNATKKTVKRKYLPYIEHWDGEKEYPKKEYIFRHKDCMFFDESACKCCKTITQKDGTKVIRNVVVIPDEIMCHANFVHKL